jgi:hypothetical protein
MATPENSSPNPASACGDSVLALEDPSTLELDLLGSECLEQTAPPAEEHRDDMELELVEDAGGKRELPVPAAGTSTFLSPAASLA